MNSVFQGGHLDASKDYGGKSPACGCSHGGEVVGSFHTVNVLVMYPATKNRNLQLSQLQHGPHDDLCSKMWRVQDN